MSPGNALNDYNTRQIKESVITNTICHILSESSHIVKIQPYIAPFRYDNNTIQISLFLMFKFSKFIVPIGVLDLNLSHLQSLTLF